MLTVLLQCFASDSEAFGEVPQLQFIDEWWLLQLKLWCRLEIYGAVLMGVDLHVVVQMILRKVSPRTGSPAF